LQHFVGLPRHLLIQQFLQYSSQTAVASMPVRPRTKGKDERNVGYVKSNCLTGHTISTWDTLEAHIAWWMREVSDVQRHSTTNERPTYLFEREEEAALQTLPHLPQFHAERRLVRIVHHDAHISVDQNR
jgi:hypothetical protein